MIHSIIVKEIYSFAVGTCMNGPLLATLRTLLAKRLSRGSGVWRDHIASRHFYIKYIPRIPSATFEFLLRNFERVLTCALITHERHQGKLGSSKLGSKLFWMDTTRGNKNRTRNRLVRALRNFETWIKYFLNGHHRRKYETLPVEATIMTVIFPVSLIDRKVRQSSPNWYAGCIYASWDGRIICA